MSNKDVNFKGSETEMRWARVHSIEEQRKKLAEVSESLTEIDVSDIDPAVNDIISSFNVDLLEDLIAAMDIQLKNLYIKLGVLPLPAKLATSKN